MKENENIKKFKMSLENYLRELKNMDFDKSKQIWFLFGAGFNFNISDNAKSWDDLAKDSFNDFLKQEVPDRTDFERNAIISKLSDTIGNRLMLSMIEKEDKKILKFPNIELNSSDLQFQIKSDLKKIMNKFDTTIYTLNYDRLIEKMLGMSSNNLLNGNETDKNKINHLHGVIDNKNELGEGKLLTIVDYLLYQDKISSQMKEIFSSELKYETIPHMFIIGSSMNEDHILKALRKDDINKESTKKIIWLTSWPNEDYIFKGIQKTYGKLGIEILNYNFDENASHKENFKLAWKIMISFLMNDRIISNSFSSIENFDSWRGVQNINKDELEELLEKIGDKSDRALNDIVSNLINFNKIDANELFKIKTRFPKKLKIIGYLRMVKRGKTNKLNNLDEEIVKGYFYAMNKILTADKIFYHESYIEELSIFTSYSKWNTLLEEKAFARIAEEIIVFDLSIFNRNKINEAPYKNKYINVDNILNWKFRLNEFANHEKYIRLIGLIEQNLELNWKHYKVATINSLKLLVNDKSLSLRQKYLITFTNRWQNFFLNNFNKVIKCFYNLQLSEKHVLFTIMYYVYIKNTSKRECFVDFANSQSDIKRYPDNMVVLSINSRSGSSYSELDGKYIKDIKPFKNMDEIKTFVEKMKKVKDDKVKWWFETEELFNKFRGMIMPKDIDEITRFIKDFLKTIKEIGIGWSDFWIRNVIFSLDVEKIDDLIKIINLIDGIKRDGFWKKEGIPFQYWNTDLVNAFIENNTTKKALSEIKIKKYKQLFFLQTHNMTYSNGYHLTQDWFKKWRDFKDDEKIEQCARDQLENYIKDQDLINEIIENGNMDKIDISNKNWDWLYFKWHYRSSDKISIKHEELLSVIKKPGSLVKDNDLVNIFQETIYNEKLYENLQLFRTFIEELGTIENINKIKELCNRIAIYSLSKHQNGNKHANSKDMKFFFGNVKFSSVMNIFRHYHDELDSEIIAKFMEYSEQDHVPFMEDSYLPDDVELDANIKAAIAIKIEQDIENHRNYPYSFITRQINEIIEKFKISLSDKAKKELEELAPLEKN